MDLPSHWYRRTISQNWIQLFIMQYVPLNLYELTVSYDGENNNNEQRYCAIRYNTFK